MKRSRRNFLIGVPVLLAGLAAYEERYKFASLLFADKARIKVLAFIAHPSHVAIIGNAYLFKFPDGLSDKDIITQLEGFLGIYSWSLSEKELEQALLQSIQNDYESNQTMLLDGWILSRTEAAVAGLVAVIYKN